MISHRNVLDDTDLQIQDWPVFVFPRIHPLTWDASSLRSKVYSRHDPFRLSNVSSSSAMKNRPVSTPPEKPLEQSLADFSRSRSSANFCSYSRNKFPSTSASIWENRVCSRKFCRYTHWIQVPSRGGFPRTSWVSGQFSTQIRYCSVDTELIDGSNCLKKQFNGVITTVEVNGFHSLSFHFHFSFFKCAGSTEYRIVRFQQNWQSCPQQFCPILQQVCWHESHESSSPIQALETTNVLAWIFKHTQQLCEHSQYNLLCFLVFSNECHCTSTSRWSFLWSAPVDTLIQKSVSSGSRREFTIKWILGKLYTRLPLRWCDPILLKLCVSKKKNFNLTLLIPPRHSTESEKT